ncbi:hypothetical protein K1T71_002923 [Dendrolimus kikuchii]|uniref:Uncharacterized protein n=1 Tax=Dendrolimus kikuchii TaxID=765133 RepID=A0ACC1DB59_9NEOP|nr:hypothetical protein K1T71_002923 [Dendrolimus kikuchii]
MSWPKQPHSGVPPPGSERQSYAAPQPQHYNTQQPNMYQNYQGVPGNTQQYWQTPQAQQPQYNQQYGQVYQQDLPANANQFYQQPQYNQNYQYSNPNYQQQNYYQNQPVQQNVSQKPNTDSWEDNWDWGWDDSSKNQKPSIQQQQQSVQPQQQLFNNANVIEESFAKTDSWNWSMDEKKEKENVAAKDLNEPPTLPMQSSVLENNIPEPVKKTSNTQPAEEVKNLSDRDVVKERLPNLALGKRFHLDNLTPQWSIESQMSQESSDGPHTQSEGTYRSDNQSRNSSKSSPGPNTDNSNFNYTQPALEEYSQNSEWSQTDEATITDTIQNGSRRESRDELINSMQDMSLNHQNPTGILEYGYTQEGLHQPPMIPSPANFLPPPTSNQPARPAPNMPPPPPISSVNIPARPPSTTALPHPEVASTPPLQPTSTLIPATSTVLPPASSSSKPLLPPPPLMSVPAQPSVSLPPSSTGSALATVPSLSLPPASNLPPPFVPPASTNPFKHAGPFSHKSTKPLTGPPQPFATQIPSANLVSSVSKIQHRMPIGFEANLETTPDNSERPDQPQMSSYRPLPVTQQEPDNLEVAPQNDRNEYLQTAHLSSSDYGENTDFSRSAPPPGLRRMVVGQQESEYSQNLNISGDEPPPGLARMVPGQQTEAGNGYNQTNESYMDRHVDGQTTDGVRPYRQADGQQISDSYSQGTTNRASERRPIGFDRMVPGEPSNEEFPQYTGSNYVSSNEQRVVTGVDHDFPMSVEAGPSDIREQNVDGSDYSEHAPRNPAQTPDFVALDDQQREVTMEGENLEDLSIISSGELTYSREQMVSGADLVEGPERKTDLSDSLEPPVTSSRRQSLNRNTSGDDSERDKIYKASPKRDRDKYKSTRDRERDREKEKDGRYSRDDRKYDREERRSTRDDRRDRDRRDRNRDKDHGRRDRAESPDVRKHRRSTRSHRYETEDTDYYSDRERDIRRTREGSYTSSKPPRPDDGSRRYGDDRERNTRHNTIERERRYDDDRPRRRGDRRSERYDRDTERGYRDIDPTRKYGNLRRTRDEDRRRGERYSPSRPDSREATATDDDLNESHRRSRRHRNDPYYDGYGSAGVYGDPYLVQRQYQYYEHLRRTDPAAYMRVYQQLMAGQTPQLPYQQMYAEGYSSLGYDTRTEERGSVHSGRSSTTGLKGNDTDLNTDASLNLHLEESTVRSERMTPFRFSTAHIKGSVGSRDVVVVRPSYPVDGLPATVHILSLTSALAQDPQAAELNAYPGPLIKGVTHKKSVVEYCALRARSAPREAPRDPNGYGLLWELLALLLTQNGVVVGTDIAELLMKNTKEYEYRTSSNRPTPRSDSRRESSGSGEAREEGARSPSPDQPSISNSDITQHESVSSPGQSGMDEKAALDRMREYLIYGNRQEALEWAMSNRLWGHALQLSAFGDRRTRASVAARFLAALPRADPLHTLYSTLAANRPPAATCVSDEKWGDWRPHAAIILSNTSAKPDQDKRTLVQLGDSLSSRGLLYSAQFCYMSAGVEVGRHPLAPLQPPDASTASQQPPPRLSLLLADPKASTLAHFATNRAIFATEIYEYAQSLSQDYVITELQVYKLLVATRLVDAGQYERALAYTEQAARAVTRNPHHYSRALVHHLANLADRLKYHDPSLNEDPPLVEEGGESAEPSPRHQQWLDDVKGVAHMLTETASQASQQATPHHQPNGHYTQYGWIEQQAPQYQPTTQAYHEPVEETPDYAAQYYQQQAQMAGQPSPQLPAPLAPPPPDEGHYAYEDWPRAEEHPAQAYADPYWQQDAGYGYEAEEARPTITMPGAPAAKQPHYQEYDDDRPPSADQQTDRETDTPKTAKQENKSKDDEGKSKDGAKRGGGWLGGILTKLSLRPPNQMILPDDKNPTIVWDAEKKRWRNLDGDAEGSEQPPPPPPKTAELPPTLQQNASPPLQAPAMGGPPAAPTSNIFKMQKGRHIKKSYVDVFNPSGAATRPLPPAAEVLGPAPAPLAAAPTYFVPAPAPLTQSGIYDTTQVGNNDDQYRSGI